MQLCSEVLLLHFDSDIIRSSCFCYSILLLHFDSDIIGIVYDFNFNSSPLICESEFV